MKRKILNLMGMSLLLLFAGILYNSYAQTPTEDEIDRTVSYTESGTEALTLPVDDGLTFMLTLKNFSEQEQIKLTSAFSAQDAQAVQDIVTIYLDNGYSLEQIAALLKDAGFDLEDAFTGMLDAVGAEEITNAIAALLDAGYDTGEVFQLGIIYLKTINPAITDEELIEALLGQEDVDMDLWMAAMQEIFIDKMQGVGLTTRAQIVQAMVDAGFNLADITDALLENGFTLDEIAEIYKKCDYDVAATYDLLINAGDGQDVSLVFSALISAGYNSTEVISCVVDKLITDHSISEIVNLIIGAVDPEDEPTQEQVNYANILAEVLVNSKGQSVQEVANAFVSQGFGLEDTADILKSLDVSVADAYTVLCNTSLGSDKVAVAKALITSGYTQGEVYPIVVPELVTSGYSMQQIITMLVGEIDPEDGATPEQINSAFIIADILIYNGTGTIEELCDVFLIQGFSLSNAALFLQMQGINDEEQAFTILKNANGGQSVVDVVFAMEDVGYDKETSFTLAINDLKSQGKSVAEIINIFVGTIEQGKNPSSTQKTTARYLLKIMLSQGDSLQTICEGLLATGFDLDVTAWVMENEGISLNDAYNALINANGGQDIRDVCSSLTDAGYNGIDVYTIAIEYLEGKGATIEQIINTLIGVVPQGESPSDTQQKDAKYILQILLGKGESLVSICNAFLAINFSLEDTADLLKNAKISVTDAYNALLDVGDGQQITDVCNALIEGGYKVADVYAIAVPELINQGYTTAQIVTMLIGEISADDGATGTQESNARYLLVELQKQGKSLQEIGGELLNAGFTLNEVASIFKKTSISIHSTYSALVSCGQDTVEVTNALIESGYSIGEVFTALVPELKNEGKTTVEIITMLIGEINPDTGPTEDQMTKTILLAGVLEDNGDSKLTICNALFDAGFMLDAAALVLKGMGVSLEDAYTILFASNGGQDTAQVGVALINAGYDTESVFNLVVPILQNQGKTTTQIISSLIGAISTTGGPTEDQLEQTMILVDLFDDQGIPLTTICDSLYAAGFSLGSIAEVLKGGGISLDDAYLLLMATGEGTQDVADVGIALLEGGYDVDDVFEKVVPELKALGSSIAEIIDLFVGEIETGGATSQQISYATALIKIFIDDDDAVLDIGSALETQGFTLKNIASIFKNAGVTAEDAFNSLLEFGSGQDPVELAKTLIDDGKYDGGDVFTVLTGYFLGQGKSIQEIFDLVIGTIDPEDGATDEQKQDAANVLYGLLENDKTLEDVTVAIFNAGFTLDEAVTIMKDANVALTDAFPVLLAKYVGQPDEVIIRSITTALVKGGYDDFDVYLLAVNTLKTTDPEITDTEVIDILIGDCDPENKDQVQNAATLTKVILFKEVASTADNTFASFMSLFEKGYNIEDITAMLLDKGFTQEQIDATLNDNYNAIVHDLAKSGHTAREIVALLINSSNKADYEEQLAEQLIRNNFDSWTTKSAFFQIGVTQADLVLIDKGIKAASGYDITETAEAVTLQEMLDTGVSLQDISTYFAQEGYQLEYVAKLFDALGISLEDSFAALTLTQSEYASGMITNDNAVLIALLDIHSDADVFTVASEYYKGTGMSTEEIVYKLASAVVSIDTKTVLADTLADQYYISLATLTPQSFITLFHAGFSVTWIKDTLMGKGYTETEIEDFIQDHDTFGEIYNGLRDKGESALSIVVSFEISKSPGEYTALLAEFMIVDECTEEYVRSVLEYYGGKSSDIERGIANGLEQL
ncbi:MAG: hypothetical protein HY810_10005 [Candidatus Omnitrophica bacterium]|nr:hypothetical protein [Candidatus Omnitrophota bacterium]